MRGSARLRSMKKLINDPGDVVDEALEGLAAAHPDTLRVNLKPRYVVRADGPIVGKVALVSGGGSGHEPLHTGYVGRGMLDAACPGPVFTSPTPDQMAEATKAADGGAGVLYIVKNYTDDVAVTDSLYTAGRRGVGATVLAEKIAGAAAEEGRSLAEVAAVARSVNERSRSMGIALTSCTVPLVGRPTFELGADEIEVGIGIHGEPGRRREPLRAADEIVELLAGPILEDLPFEPGNEVLAFVNGMGATPLLELFIVYRRLAELLEDRGLRVVRRLVGSYITSLDMAGCSVTLLKVDQDLLRLWDAPVATPALTWG